MLVLALDTTTRGGSCALVHVDGETIRVRERPGDVSRAQAARLPGELMTLLREEGHALGDVTVFAVAVGPGSFTGLRIGIAAMQGLAFAERKGLIGVSALDALAVHGRQAGHRVATWVDAWRGEVFAALYEDGAEVEGPTVESPDRVLARLTRMPTVFIGDAVAGAEARIRQALGDHARVATPSSPLLAGTIGRLAVAAARRAVPPPPDAVRPLYVRRPDVEITRDARAAR